MNPYQQIPVGIPVSQNAYPSHPYSQNFPEEPDSEPSQIQAASLNNNPQSLGYGQPGQAFNQPAQIMMVGGLPPVDPERRRLEKNIKDAEAKLDSGCPFIYKLWLYSSIFCSSLLGFPCCLVLLGAVLFIPFEKIGSPDFGAVLIVTSWCFWVLKQCLIMKNAINNKSLEGARRGLRWMKWYAIYYLPSMIVFFLLYKLDTARKNEDVHENYSAYDYTMALISCYIPIFINIAGAETVTKLLEERETLVLEWNTRFGGNYLV